MRATFLIAGVLAAIVASATAARAEVTIALDNQYNTVSGRPPLYGYRGSDAPVVIQPSNRTEFKLGQGVTLIISTTRPIPPTGRLCAHKSQPGGANFAKLEVKDNNGRPGCGESRGF